MKRKKCYTCGKKANPDLYLEAEVMIDNNEDNVRDIGLYFCSEECVKKECLRLCKLASFDWLDTFIDTFEDIDFRDTEKEVEKLIKLEQKKFKKKLKKCYK